jgi:hypothetical protein
MRRSRGLGDVYKRQVEMTSMFQLKKIMKLIPLSMDLY